MSNSIDDIPTVDAMVASKFLGADSLHGPEVVTITAIRRSMETFDAGKKEKVNVFGIRRADGQAAEVLFCKTNVYACRVLLGDEPAKWLGKRVTLVVDQDLYANALVDCIRIGGSPDAPPGRIKAYSEAFDHPEGRPRKLVKRLKAICMRAKRTAGPAAPAPATPPPAERPRETINPTTGEVTEASAAQAGGQDDLQSRLAGTPRPGPVSRQQSPPRQRSAAGPTPQQVQGAIDAQRSSAPAGKPAGSWF